MSNPQDEIYSAINEIQQRIINVELQQQQPPVVNVAPTPVNLNPNVEVQIPNVHREHLSIPMPDKFDGKRNFFEDFMLSVNNYMGIKAHLFTNESIKCRFIGSLLTKEALTWYRILNKSNPEILDDYQAFMTAFIKKFEDPHACRNAQEKLMRLKQGKDDVPAYAEKFLKISTETNYNEAALIVFFRRGLHEEIQDALALSLEDVNDLNAYMELCVQIDIRLRQRRSEKKSYNAKINPFDYQGKKFHKTSSFSGNTSSNSGNNMEVDHTTITKSKKLTDEERQRRINEKLCLYCGKPNHKAKECPAKSKPKN